MRIGWRGAAGGAAVVLATVFGLPAVGPSNAGADPSAQEWATLRACESSGRYGVVATHGHYGAYQFDLATWESVGGTGLPSDASPAEQDYRALYLYRMRGWQPWECAGMRGLVPDADARSKRVPTRGESAYMAPGAPREVRAAAPAPAAGAGGGRRTGLAGGGARLRRLPPRAAGLAAADEAARVRLHRHGLLPRTHPGRRAGPAAPQRHQPLRPARPEDVARGLGRVTTRGARAVERAPA